MTQPHVFTFNNQTLGYANDDILKVDSLNILRGEKVALLGISGSGKTTLLQSLYQQQKQSTAYCPQQLGLVDILSVFHNIYMGSLQRHNLAYNILSLVSPRPRELIEIGLLCDQFKLRSKLRTSIDQLSGGQRQRTALARAIYRQADIFLGDEPVSAVDNYQADTLLQLVTNKHQTVVVALHDREQALTHFDRVIGLRQGEIVVDERTANLKEQDLAEIYRN
ncbi:MAG: phosphonate transport system ATP-binding protein [Oceanicoccus sp.]|jgi:phosphonate transport system ATP-binding protein